MTTLHSDFVSFIFYDKFQVWMEKKIWDEKLIMMNIHF